MKSYVIKMTKEGNPRGHSYIVGAFSNLLQASLLGKIEEMSLDGNYKFEIIEIDSFDSESVKINLFFKKIGKSENMTNLIVKHYKESHALEDEEYMKSLHLASEDHIELFSDELKSLFKRISNFSKEEQVVLKSMHEEIAS